MTSPAAGAATKRFISCSKPGLVDREDSSLESMRTARSSTAERGPQKMPGLRMLANSCWTAVIVCSISARWCCDEEISAGLLGGLPWNSPDVV